MNSRSELTSAVSAKPGFTIFYRFVAVRAFANHYLAAHIAVLLFLSSRIDFGVIGAFRTNNIPFLSRHFKTSSKCNQAPVRVYAGLSSLQGDSVIRAGVLSIIFSIFSYITAISELVNYKLTGA